MNTKHTRIVQATRALLATCIALTALCSRPLMAQEVPSDCPCFTLGFRFQGLAPNGADSTFALVYTLHRAAFDRMERIVLEDSHGEHTLYPAVSSLPWLEVEVLEGTALLVIPSYEPLDLPVPVGATGPDGEVFSLRQVFPDGSSRDARELLLQLRLQREEPLETGSDEL